LAGVTSTDGLRVAGLRSALAGPFDLDLEGGAILAVSGPSGAGKTLFLRLLADLDPGEGMVVLNGENRQDMPAPLWRRRAPYVAAESGWWAPGVDDHFPLGDRESARAIAGRLGVAEALFGGPVARLSTGERQRLALTRALALNAPLLLLDEPTGPLDPDSTAKVEALLLERAAAGTIVVLVTHEEAQGTRLHARTLRIANRAPA